MQKKKRKKKYWIKRTLAPLSTSWTQLCKIKTRFSHTLKHRQTYISCHVFPLAWLLKSFFPLSRDIQNFAYLIFAAYFPATGGGYDKLEVYKCSDGVKAPAVTGEMVIRFPSCMVSWRHKEFHMVIQMPHLNLLPISTLELSTELVTRASKTWGNRQHSYSYVSHRLFSHFWSVVIKQELRHDKSLFSSQKQKSVVIFYAYMMFKDCKNLPTCCDVPYQICHPTFADHRPHRIMRLSLPGSKDAGGLLIYN